MRTLVLLAVALAASAAGTVGALDPERLYRQGRKAERSRDFARAYLFYSHAAALAPENQIYWLRSQAVRSRAALQAKVKPAPVTAAPPAGSEAGVLLGGKFSSITAQDFANARQPQPPKELRAAAGRRDFDLQGDARSLFEQVARAFSLEVVFDGDYRP
ncbi:MAG: hypothetical protein FJW37_13900, partial [Acidobacteria bacterium]|nr:hypothetical protein [Acidobacteriota bacterium]